MKTSLDCISCFVRQATEAVAFCVPDETRRAEILRGILRELAQSDWSGVAPKMGQLIHRIIRRETGVVDPYADMKRQMNRLASELLPSLQQEACLARDPRAAMVRVAIAGNLLDAGAKSGLTVESCRSTISRACRGECLKGGADRLFDSAARAQRILYLADNAGEIVFDRALIEMLPMEKLTVAVRGVPVINDATIEDALAAGLPALVTVLSNGSDAPGTLLDDCSSEFRHVFEQSDMVISKGQGNYESLSETDKHTFFLLQVKCDCVARHLGVAVGATALCEKTGADQRVRSCALT